MRVSLILFFYLFYITGLFAWGQTGHRVVGKIAENHLTGPTKIAIKNILGEESLAVASTWMDEVRSDTTYDYMNDWHWVTIPSGKTYAQTSKNPKGDIISLIEKCRNVLKLDTALSVKKEYLRILIHLVGDIHQPLHVGNGEDKGGNSVRLRWFNSPSNLHRIWDSGMIDSKKFSYTELADIVKDVSPLYAVQLASSTTVDWAHEAMEYRNQIYSFGDKNRLGYDYLYQNWDLVQEQLLKAGIRLAAVLNEIFSE